MTIRRPLHPGVGFEAENFDAAAATAGDAAELRDLLLGQPLLVLRDQRLDAEGLVGFTRLLGEPLEHPAHPAYPDLPQVAPLSNVPDKGRLAVPYWHTDGLLRPDAPALTLFYAVEVPARGGDTLFVNAYDAFDRLDPEDQATLEGVTAVFETGTEHPLVRSHPVSGRKGLNANLGATVGLVGVERESARRLFTQLMEHVAQPELVYRHRYRPGDLLIWDNVGVLHSATEPPPPGSTRLMLRTDVAT